MAVRRFRSRCMLISSVTSRWHMVQGYGLVTLRCSLLSWSSSIMWKRHSFSALYSQLYPIQTRSTSDPFTFMLENIWLLPLWPIIFPCSVEQWLFSWPSHSHLLGGQCKLHWVLQHKRQSIVRNTLPDLIATMSIGGNLAQFDIEDILSPIQDTWTVLLRVLVLGR